MKRNWVVRHTNQNSPKFPLQPEVILPYEEERKALDELEAYEAKMEDVQEDCEIERLAMAFKAVPNYHTIIITPRCAFQHRLLKKTWDECAPGSCVKSTGKPQIEHLLKAVELAGLYPRHLIIEELSSRFALAGSAPEEFPKSITSALKELETFYLCIEDFSDVMGETSHLVYDMLRTMLSSLPKVKSVSLYIASTKTTVLPLPEH